MRAVGDSFGLAAEVLIILTIITVGFLCLRTVNKASRVATESINSTTTEYQNSGIVSLTASEHTGLAVKKYIAKYSRQMRVGLSTLKSSAAHAAPAEYTATVSYSEINDSDSLYYVERDSVFICTADKDSNGNYAYLLFSQKGVTTDTQDTVITTDDEAKAALIQRLGLSSYSSWDDIYGAVDASIDSDNDSKHSLVAALGTGSVTDASSWSDITDTAVNLLKSYRDTLASNEVAVHNKYSCMLGYQESAVLTFTPDVVTVLKSSGGSSTAEAFCWVKNAGWIGRDPGILVDGNKIINSDSSNVSDTASIAAYN